MACEHRMGKPVAATPVLHPWAGLPPPPCDPQALPVKPGERDSHYPDKHPHRTLSHIRPPAPHPVPPRIARNLRSQFGDSSRTCYSGFNTD